MIFASVFLPQMAQMTQILAAHCSCYCTDFYVFKANISKNLEELGLELTPEQQRRVTERITELGDKKEIVTQEDLPYIVSDVLKHDAPEDKVKLVSYVVSTAYGLKPGANIKVEINGQQYEASATGDGQYDAFVKSLRYIYKKYLDRTFPILQN